MDALTILSTLISLGACSAYKHDFNLEIGDKKAGSYQSVRIQHFHPEPVFIKKGNKQRGEQPLPAGETVSNVEINHGDKDSPGYAVQSTSDESHIFKSEDDSPSALAEFEDSHGDPEGPEVPEAHKGPEGPEAHEDDHVSGGYQVQEDYHSQQPYYPQEHGQHSYYPQEGGHHHYDYIPRGQHPGLSQYYSYPEESQTNFRYHPIVAAEQEKS